MRLSYLEDEEYPGQYALWRANCARSMRGRRGQASLRALKDALLALPAKRLIAHKMQDETGAVCAIGALSRQKGLLSDHDSDNTTVAVGERCGLPHLVSLQVVIQNDVELAQCTEKQRYVHMLKWIEEQLH